MAQPMTQIERARLERLLYAFRKFEKWTGTSQADLIEEGYLEPGDLDPPKEDGQ